MRKVILFLILLSSFALCQLIDKVYIYQEYNMGQNTIPKSWTTVRNFYDYTGDVHDSICVTAFIHGYEDNSGLTWTGYIGNNLFLTSVPYTYTDGDVEIPNQYYEGHTYHKISLMAYNDSTSYPNVMGGNYIHKVDTTLNGIRYTGLPSSAFYNFIPALAKNGYQLYTYARTTNFNSRFAIQTLCNNNNFNIITPLLWGNGHTNTINGVFPKHMVFSGAGNDSNKADYEIEFYWNSSNYSNMDTTNTYTSFASNYIAGQLSAINNGRYAKWGKCNFEIARYAARMTASNNGVYSTKNGFGRINVQKAIDYEVPIWVNKMTHTYIKKITR